MATPQQPEKLNAHTQIAMPMSASRVTRAAPAHIGEVGRVAVSEICCFSILPPSPVRRR
jgi:hypothetical protein